jgi:adenine deaminase
MDDRAHLIAVARGDAEPDLVVAGAQVFAAHTREWLDGDVAIAGGRIAGVGAYRGGERIHAAGRPLVPGFIDAHVHLESSKLTPAEFARAVVARGTTAVVCDPHEIANVAGVAGVEWMLAATEALPLDVYVMAPSCVPASPFESPHGALGPEAMAAIVEHPRALGVAEMMNFPAVIAGEPAELAKLAVAPRADGHAPGVVGRPLDAYVAAGIRTDHESTTVAEALEKRRRGMWVLIREASNARNLEALLELVREHGPEHCAFCTDDREPDFLVRDGHIDQMCRAAVRAGIPPEDALLLATLHPATCHGLDGAGAITPGRRADLVLLDDLEGFRARLVLKDGVVVARDGETLPFPHDPPPAALTGTVRCAPLSCADFALPAAERARVIEIVPGQLITRAAEAAPTDEGLAKIAVVERHHGSGRVGVGLVRGFGLATGAFASTVAHDAHNLVIVGVDDADMLVCGERLCELGGGIAVARDGAVCGELALPVAGLLSDAPAAEVVAALEALQDRLRDQGVAIEAPFMTLSFLALSVIPALKITDRGLVDVERFQLVPLAL